MIHVIDDISEQTILNICDGTVAKYTLKLLHASLLNR